LTASLSVETVTWIGAAVVFFSASVTPVRTSEMTFVERATLMPSTEMTASLSGWVTLKPGSGSAPVVRPLSSIETAFAVPGVFAADDETIAVRADLDDRGVDRGAGGVESRRARRRAYCSRR
jgi:hypothetical protein